MAVEGEGNRLAWSNQHNEIYYFSRRTDQAT